MLGAESYSTEEGFFCGVARRITWVERLRRSWFFDYVLRPAVF